eukprot:snap_masked-scaffold_34-processed-gene-3.56-mRNA-1 protein AED:1.00 eAED:1.00 QI:0/0/0/0/1/1/2/0/1384
MEQQTTKFLSAVMNKVVNGLPDYKGGYFEQPVESEAKALLHKSGGLSDAAVSAAAFDFVMRNECPRWSKYVQRSAVRAVVGTLPIIGTASAVFYSQFESFYQHVRFVALAACIYGHNVRDERVQTQVLLCIIDEMFMSKKETKPKQKEIENSSPEVLRLENGDATKEKEKLDDSESIIVEKSKVSKVRKRRRKRQVSDLEKDIAQGTIEYAATALIRKVAVNYSIQTLSTSFLFNKALGGVLVGILPELIAGISHSIEQSNNPESMNSRLGDRIKSQVKKVQEHFKFDMTKKPKLQLLRQSLFFLLFSNVIKLFIQFHLFFVLCVVLAGFGYKYQEIVRKQTISILNTLPNYTVATAVLAIKTILTVFAVKFCTESFKVFYYTYDVYHLHKAMTSLLSFYCNLCSSYYNNNLHEFLVYDDDDEDPEPEAEGVVLFRDTLKHKVITFGRLLKEKLVFIHGSLLIWIAYYLLTLVTLNGFDLVSFFYLHFAKIDPQNLLLDLINFEADPYHVWELIKSIDLGLIKDSLGVVSTVSLNIFLDQLCQTEILFATLGPSALMQGLFIAAKSVKSFIASPTDVLYWLHTSSPPFIASLIIISVQSSYIFLGVVVGLFPYWYIDKRMPEPFDDQTYEEGLKSRHRILYLIPELTDELKIKLKLVVKYYEKYEEAFQSTEEAISNTLMSLRGVRDQVTEKLKSNADVAMETTLGEDSWWARTIKRFRTQSIEDSAVVDLAQEEVHSTKAPAIVEAEENMATRSKRWFASWFSRTNNGVSEKTSQADSHVDTTGELHHATQVSWFSRLFRRQGDRAEIEVRATLDDLILRIEEADDEETQTGVKFLTPQGNSINSISKDVLREDSAPNESWLGSWFNRSRSDAKAINVISTEAPQEPKNPFNSSSWFSRWFGHQEGQVIPEVRATIDDLISQLEKEDKELRESNSRVNELDAGFAPTDDPSDKEVESGNSWFGRWFSVARIKSQTILSQDNPLERAVVIDDLVSPTNGEVAQLNTDSQNEVSRLAQYLPEQDESNSEGLLVPDELKQDRASWFSSWFRKKSFQETEQEVAKELVEIMDDIHDKLSNEGSPRRRKLSSWDARRSLSFSTDHEGSISGEVKRWLAWETPDEEYGTRHRATSEFLAPWWSRDTQENDHPPDTSSPKSATPPKATMISKRFSAASEELELERSEALETLESTGNQNLLPILSPNTLFKRFSLRSPTTELSSFAVEPEEKYGDTEEQRREQSKSFLSLVLSWRETKTLTAEEEISVLLSEMVEKVEKENTWFFTRWFSPTKGSSEDLNETTEESMVSNIENHSIEDQVQNRLNEIISELETAEQSFYKRWFSSWNQGSESQVHNQPLTETNELEILLNDLITQIEDEQNSFFSKWFRG